MPKTYTKQHFTAKSHREHIAKIKSLGGVILSDDGRTLKYHFPSTYINKKYTHFAVRRKDGKIINGWDYSGYPAEELNSDKEHYFFFDLRDNETDKSTVSIVTKQFLIKKNILPFDTRYWSH